MEIDVSEALEAKRISKEIATDLPTVGDGDIYVTCHVSYTIEAGGTQKICIRLREYDELEDSLSSLIYMLVDAGGDGDELARQGIKEDEIKELLEQKLDIDPEIDESSMDASSVLPLDK